jgi:hypothetical protein
MKPITGIVGSTVLLLGIGAGASVAGWIGRNEPLVSIGAGAFVLGLAVACVPLVALIGYQCVAAIRTRIARR